MIQGSLKYEYALTKNKKPTNGLRWFSVYCNTFKEADDVSKQTALLHNERVYAGPLLVKNKIWFTNLNQWKLERSKLNTTYDTYYWSKNGDNIIAFWSPQSEEGWVFK